MTMVLTNRTTNYDGSPAGENDVYVATGPIVVTFSKNSSLTPYVDVYSRSDTADFVFTARFKDAGRFIVNLVAGDDFYFTIPVNVSPDTIDLAYVDA